MEPSDQNKEPPANGSASPKPHRIGPQLFGLVFWILLLTIGGQDPLTIGFALVLGGLIKSYGSMFQTDYVFASILPLSLLGITIVSLIGRLERRLQWA